MISNYCTAGDSLDVCDKPDGGMIPLALHVSQAESRCKTVHSPPAASHSFWTDSRDEGPNRVGKDGLLKPFGGSTSSEEEEDISEGGKQGTPTISVIKTIIYSACNSIYIIFLDSEQSEEESVEDDDVSDEVSEPVGDENGSETVEETGVDSAQISQETNEEESEEPDDNNDDDEVNTVERKKSAKEGH